MKKLREHFFSPKLPVTQPPSVRARISTLMSTLPVCGYRWSQIGMAEVNPSEFRGRKCICLSKGGNLWPPTCLHQ